MLARFCSKFFKLVRLQQYVNLWMYKLDLEKAEKLEIKLPISDGSWRKQGNSRKTSTSASLTMLKPLTVDHKKLWKILKETGIPEHLTCLPRNLYIDQEVTVRTGHETTDWFKIEKEVRQGYIMLPSLFKLCAEYIMWNTRLDHHSLESRLRGEISITSDMQMTSHLWQKRRIAKEPLDESQRGEKKSWFNAQHSEN